MLLAEILLAAGTLIAALTAALAVTYMFLWFKLPAYARHRRGTRPLRILWYSSKVLIAIASLLIAGELDLYTMTIFTPWLALTRFTATVAMLVGIIASLSRLVYELWQASLQVQFIQMAQSALDEAQCVQVK